MPTSLFLLLASLTLATACATAELSSSGAGLESGPATGPDLAGATGPGPGSTAAPTLPDAVSSEPPEGGGGPRLGGAAPGSDAPEEAPPAPEVLPLVLSVSSPTRGSWLSGGTMRVEGTVTGGASPVLTVAGQEATPDADGRFSVEVPAVPGLNVLVTTVADGAIKREDRRAILMDADADPTAPISDGVAVKVSRSGFNEISALLSDYVSGMDLESLASANLQGNVRLRGLRYDRIEVSLVPQEGHIDIGLAIHGLHVDISATVDVPIVGDLTFDGSMDTNPGRVTGRLRASATPEGGLALDLMDSSVNLENFDYGVDGVPGFVEDWFNGMVRNLAQDTIQDALNDFVIPSLFDPSALQRTVDVMGYPVDLGVLLSRVESHSDGLEIWADPQASADMSVHQGGAVRPAGSVPSFQAGSELDVAAAADLVSRILHAAWATGALDLSLDSESGLDSPVPLTVAILAGPLGESIEGVDRSQPLDLTIRPLLPPVARLEDSDHPLVIETGDLMLDIGTANEGVIVTVALHFIARASMDVNQLADGGDIQLSPDLQVEVHADVAETPRGPVKEEALETLVQTLVGTLPAMIADQTFAFGVDALPVTVQLENARLEPDSLGKFLHLRADIRR